MSNNVSWLPVDAFASPGPGVILYDSNNRTRVIADANLIFIFCAFLASFLAFLITLPGIRKERVSTLIVVTVVMLSGFSLFMSYNGQNWHVSRAKITGPYRAFSRGRLHADIGVYQGLHSYNVTLRAIDPRLISRYLQPLSNQSTDPMEVKNLFHSMVIKLNLAVKTGNSDIVFNITESDLSEYDFDLIQQPHSTLNPPIPLKQPIKTLKKQWYSPISEELQRPEDFDFNERFDWKTMANLRSAYHSALLRGLPFPIITVAEYMSRDEEGQQWGRHYRHAGYYTSCVLVTTMFTWSVMVLLLCAVPRYGLYCMQITGVLCLLACFVYKTLLPDRELIILFENGVKLDFTCGWCFFLVMISGVVTFVVGIMLSILVSRSPNSLSTILEVDYDTPYRYFVAGPNQTSPATSTANNRKTLVSTGTQSNGLSDENSDARAILARGKSDAATLTDDPEISDSGRRVPDVLTLDGVEVRLRVRSGSREVGIGICKEIEGIAAAHDEKATQIYGKRAVSLINFGRWAEQKGLGLPRQRASGMDFI